jgi:hypothetical protein
MQLSLWPQPALQQQPAHGKSATSNHPTISTQNENPSAEPFFEGESKSSFFFFCLPDLRRPSTGSLSRRRITTNFAPCLTGARLRQVSAAGVTVPQSPVLGPAVMTLPQRRG